ncbi:hypothetical protein [Hyphobacterium sp.]|uniref:hypothetical protein n=1 Tax=Hyphobacterium sp. TaxID=2004662 RepID=UPI003B529BE4
MKKSTPPPEYLDGCTLAPDCLGRVSHKDICNDHDLDYWSKRTLLDKVVADARWAGRIMWRHRANFPWQPVAIVLAIVGWLGVTLVGGWMWKFRHRWD